MFSSFFSVFSFLVFSSLPEAKEESIFKVDLGFPSVAVVLPSRQKFLLTCANVGTDVLYEV